MVHLFDALGIARAPVLAFSAGSTSAVQLALRHPDRVSALVLVAANSRHEKPVTLAPRALAPLVLSQPTLWFLRVFLPSKLAAIAGKPVDYELREPVAFPSPSGGADRRRVDTLAASVLETRRATEGLRWGRVVFDVAAALGHLRGGLRLGVRRLVLRQFARAAIRAGALCAA